MLNFRLQNLRGVIIGGIVLIFFAQLPVAAQQGVTVQPGAPGQSTRVLSSPPRAVLPPTSKKDVEFMQGMILHHEQAVEMTAMIESRTENKNIRLIGARISQSQIDEMNFMRHWLDLRGEPNATANHGSHGGDHHKLMPGMLMPIQLGALKRAKGQEFDRLFLEGMIQHHKGALTMVKDLFDTAGAGQDAELFNFATDVDTGQRAEIKSMETLLNKKP